MEFFFALPFLLFIMILSMNFCKAYLMQQRVMIAARYMAWSDLQKQPQLSPTDISQRFFGGEPVEISATPRVLNREQQDQISGVLAGVLSDISYTQEYRVLYHFRPMFAAGDYFGKGRTNWYPDLEISGTILSDSKDWRYPDPSFKTILKDLLGAFGRLLGR
jgi:hypothetical protein